MNHTFRLVWNKSLSMLVAVSECARSQGKTAGAESLVANGGGLYSAVQRLRTSFSPIASAIAVSGLVISSTAFAADNMPAGHFFDVSGGNTPGVLANYSRSFTALSTGSEYLLFAFRHDPAYWYFGNTSLTVAGSSTNILLDPNFTAGGMITASGNSVMAPQNWGVVYQNGHQPSAAGNWQSSPLVGGGSGGTWVDGAVGSYDGIYQGVSLTAGLTYTMSFSAYSNSGVANTNDIRIGVYTGDCMNLFAPIAECVPGSSSGFSMLASPAQAASAGGPTT